MESAANISPEAYDGFCELLYQSAGIRFGPAKEAMLCGRLAPRLRETGLDSYEAYLRLISDSGQREELQAAVDLLTTNETYFFREPSHFDFLREKVIPAHAQGRSGRPLRLWSAACSTGEEPYSLAMLLADRLGPAPYERFEILASDISTRVLERARLGVYPMDRARNVPEGYLRRFCLRGVRSQEGSLRVDKPLRERVRFRQVNLVGAIPDVGLFDVIFLRNAMIYFDRETRAKVVQRLVQQLHPGGHFIVGLAESFHDLCDELSTVSVSVYRRG